MDEKMRTNYFIIGAVLGIMGIYFAVTSGQALLGLLLVLASISMVYYAVNNGRLIR